MTDGVVQVVLSMVTDIGQVQLRKPKAKDSPVKLFTFDGVFYTQDTTEQIYEVCTYIHARLVVFCISSYVHNVCSWIRSPLENILQLLKR